MHSLVAMFSVTLLRFSLIWLNSFSIYSFKLSNALIVCGIAEGEASTVDLPRLGFVMTPIKGLCRHSLIDSELNHTVPISKN